MFVLLHIESGEILEIPIYVKTEEKVFRYICEAALMSKKCKFTGTCNEICPWFLATKIKPLPSEYLLYDVES